MRLFTKILLASTLALISAESHSNPPDWARVHDLTMSGIHKLYNLEIDDARRTFDSVAVMAPGDPRGPFFQSVLHFYLYNLNRDERELNTFLDKSERVITLCEDLLDRNDKDVTTKFYLGGTYGYRGLAYQANGSILKAVKDGRKGFLLLEEAVTEKPDLYDAHMGFGLFNYLLAKIPPSFKWVTSMLDFEGDLEGGLRSLGYAASRGTYTRTEAKLYLAQFLFSDGKRDSALQYLGELRREYPENTLFTVLYAAWQHRMDNLDEAMSAANAAIELNNRKNIRYGEELAYSTLGSIYYTKNDFTNAATNYRLYLKATSDQARVPNFTLYRGGVASEIAGDRPSALAFYGRMRPDDSGQRGGAQQYRRAQELLRRPITEAEILMVRAGNELSRQNRESAIGLFREAHLKAGDNVDLRARALYGLQQAQFESDRLTDAVQTSERILALKPDNEPWIIPHTWFRLGQIHAKLGNKAEARRSFEMVWEYDDYEFEERLEERAEEELEKIK